MPLDEAKPIRTLAVIGAGNMGSGIAQRMATEGFPVVLVDLDDEKVARDLRTIDETLAAGVERRIFKPEHAEAIRTADAYEGLTSLGRKRPEFHGR